jgi:hypothetical protein
MLLSRQTQLSSGAGQEQQPQRANSSDSLLIADRCSLITLTDLSAFTCNLLSPQ